MLGSRLKEERERLGWTQTGLAELCGAHKRTVITWESGSTSPSGQQLAALAAAGADVLYIVTGERNVATLTTEERLLVERYRAAGAELRQALLRLVVSQDHPPQGVHQRVVAKSPGTQVAGRDITTIQTTKGRKK